MNKNTRLIVSVLFIFIIVLSVAITRFYSGSEKVNYNGSSQPDTDDIIEYDRDKRNHIFRTDDDLYGIADSNGRVVVSPEWNNLSFTSNGFCIASKHIGSKDLYGCIDYEGNITIPFIYSRIIEEKFPSRYILIAETYDDSHYVIYDSDFKPCFSQTWKKYRADGENLILYTNNGGEYTYRINFSEISFRTASVKNTVFRSVPCSLDVQCDKNSMLSELSVPMIEMMTKDFGKYIEYAFTRGKKEDAEREALISSMKCDTSSAELSILFPNEENLLCTLKTILPVSTNLTNPSVTIPSRYGDYEKPRFEIKFSAEVVVRYRENGISKKLSGNGKSNPIYTASLIFEGTSASDLRIVSGKFDMDKPDYLVKEDDKPQENNE